MNREEFNTCVDQHSDKVYRFILRYMPDADMAKDLLQDTFEKMWISRKSIEFTKAKSYLFSAVHHKIINQSIVDRRNESINNLDPDKITHNEQYSDLKDVLDKALNILPEIQKTVILLRDYGGYTYKEIGEITGLKSAQVKVYIFRARTTLREYLVRMDILI